MQVEHLEIRDHLAKHPPFDNLPDAVLDELALQVEVSYFRAGSDIFTADDTITQLHYVRSGAVETFHRNGELHNRLTEGDIFGQASLLRGGRVRLPARALEDSLIYFIPGEVFHRLCEEFDSFSDFVEAEGKSRLKAVVDAHGKAMELMRMRVRRLISRPPVSVDPQATILEAAKVMTEQGVSSILIVEPGQAWPEPSGEPGPITNEVTGIMTDRDLRTRVVAPGLDLSLPVKEVMSPHPITLQADASVYDAMLAMLRHHVHYLPIVHRRRPVGVVTLADIVRLESHNSLYVVTAIFNRSTVAELSSLVPQVKSTFVRMVGDQATAQMVGQAMSGIGRAFSQRLCELAEQELGPPPVPYCLMVAGSMARDEQLLVTDQDNALVLSDDFVPEEHGAYFERLATFVSDGFAACGYPYCKGGIMATNPRWRQPLRVWRETFLQWMRKPNPETLLHSNIFFDLDGVYGEVEFVNNLRELIAARASRDMPFLGAMTRTALKRTPPLGLFRTFVMEKDGEQKNIINLKGRGTAPLTDLIRIHALASGSTAQSSLERLEDIAAAGQLPANGVERLRYAFEFLTLVRVRHQARQIEEGKVPNNYIHPEQFSTVERHNLKEAFQVLSHAQNFLRLRYPWQNTSWGR